MHGTCVTSQADPLWSQSCSAYNLHAKLDPGCLATFAAVQERLHGLCREALVCPPPSLHLSVASLLSVRKDYGLPKQDSRPAVARPGAQDFKSLLTSSLLFGSASEKSLWAALL